MALKNVGKIEQLSSKLSKENNEKSHSISNIYRRLQFFGRFSRRPIMNCDDFNPNAPNNNQLIFPPCAITGKTQEVGDPDRKPDLLSGSGIGVSGVRDRVRRPGGWRGRFRGRFRFPGGSRGRASRGGSPNGSRGGFRNRFRGGLINFRGGSRRGGSRFPRGFRFPGDSLNGSRGGFRGGFRGGLRGRLRGGSRRGGSRGGGFRGGLINFRGGLRGGFRGARGSRRGGSRGGSRRGGWRPGSILGRWRRRSQLPIIGYGLVGFSLLGISAGVAVKMMKQRRTTVTTDEYEYMLV